MMIMCQKIEDSLIWVGSELLPQMNEFMTKGKLELEMERWIGAASPEYYGEERAEPEDKCTD